MLEQWSISRSAHFHFISYISVLLQLSFFYLNYTVVLVHCFMSAHMWGEQRTACRSQFSPLFCSQTELGSSVSMSSTFCLATPSSVFINFYIALVLEHCSLLCSWKIPDSFFSCLGLFFLGSLSFSRLKSSAVSLGKVFEVLYDLRCLYWLIIWLVGKF